jgi:hypothetical protein
MLVTPRADVALKVTAPIGEATLQEPIYAPVLELMGDHKPRTIGDIEQILLPKKIGVAQIVAAVVVLAGKGDMVPVQDDQRQSAAKPHAAKLNQALLARATRNREVNFLASPVTGGAVGVSRFQQLFLNAMASGAKTPEDWARSAWSVLSGFGQQIVKDGKQLEGPEANIAELVVQAKEFSAKRLGVLKSLKVV